MTAPAKSKFSSSTQRLTLSDVFSTTGLPTAENIGGGTRSCVLPPVELATHDEDQTTSIVPIPAITLRRYSTKNTPRGVELIHSIEQDK